MRAIVSSVLILSLLLSACGGGGGGDGSGYAALAALATAGTGTGTTSVKALVTVSAEVPGANCASGGMRITAGLDGDGNEVLAASEVGSTQYLCPGAAGASGTLVQMLAEPAGANCTAGGKAIHVGLDGNANGVLETAEISSTGYVCNSTNGGHAASEPNTLTSIAGEAAGANCAYGGNKIVTGLDSNANRVLDADEVSATNYICNCAPGAGIDVTGTAVQAQPNMCYVARNDAAQVVVTLPANPAVGDVVRISGAGQGGWKIAQNAGQAVDTKELGGMAGAHWTARESNRNWYTVASSADGTKLVAAEWGGQIHTSTDGGVSWTARESNRAWASVASSADGSKLVALVNGGQIYTSSDSGISWTAREFNRDWYSVASSADGSTLVAGVAWASGGLVYTSSDSGVTWTARESGRKWAAVASSTNGSRLAAAAWDDQIYISNDSGVNWTPSGLPVNTYGVAFSADGSKLVAAVWNGQIYTSTDGGASWTARDSNRLWLWVACSADGSKLVAVESNGQIYTSSDSGVSWTAHESNRVWYAVASSADGSKMVAIVNGGQIYTSIASTTPGAGGSISGTASDSIELQYVGDGMFTVLTHEGSLTVQ